MTGVNGTIYFGSAMACLLIIDRFGRRKMMLYGALTMGTCYMIAAMTLKAAQDDPTNLSRKKTVSPFGPVKFCVLNANEFAARRGDHGHVLHVLLVSRFLFLVAY